VLDDVLVVFPRTEFIKLELLEVDPEALLTVFVYKFVLLSPTPERDELFAEDILDELDDADE
jgi:hypothetical protein